MAEMSAADRIRDIPDGSVPTNPKVQHRNFVLEMRRIIDEETATGEPYSSTAVARHIANKLRAEDPDLLTGWLDLQAHNVLRDAINRRDSSIRTHAKRTASRTAFGNAAKQYNEGDSEALGGFLAVVHATADGLRRKLSEMTAKDLMYVASTYNKRADENAMQASFLEALAKRLHGNQTVADVYDEQRLSKMWLSISEGSTRKMQRSGRTRARTQSAEVPASE
jgi:hypothetical protein